MRALSIQQDASSTGTQKKSNRGTSTNSFGNGKRESHDASSFYNRFPIPQLSSDTLVNPPTETNKIWLGDARQMDTVGNIADNSVALVLTSPPYYVGKDYELAVGEGHVPSSYVEYLDMLEEVFACCVQKLEPGGRIAVNVANLGRKPYRSLSSDVISILQDKLRLLLRGEIIWKKAAGAGGSCAWGSFQQPANPVLRDTTERIIVASKGRFGRALTAVERYDGDIPFMGSATADEFMEATVDVWDIQPESATRIGHPAPFPVEIPERLIHLYTYRKDLVLDPFMGSGTTAVAAIRTERHYVGFDTDPGYVQLAEERIQTALDDPTPPTLMFKTDAPSKALRSHTNGAFANKDSGANTLSRVKDLLQVHGFQQIETKVSAPCGVKVPFKAVDPSGRAWLFEVVGAFGMTQIAGMRRMDALWSLIGKGSVLHSSSTDPIPLVVLTSQKPRKNSGAAKALENVTGPGKIFHDVIDLSDVSDIARLGSIPTVKSVSQ